MTMRQAKATQCGDKLTIKRGYESAGLTVTVISLVGERYYVGKPAYFFEVEYPDGKIKVAPHIRFVKPRTRKGA